MKKAFTLIELMIVVAIIAIIAAIAIPNLLESKKAANEGNGGTSLKAYATNQVTYQSNNYSASANNSSAYGAYTANGIAPEVAKLFCTTWQGLGGTSANIHQDAVGNNLQLIPIPFGNADAAATAYNGYWYLDVTDANAAVLTTKNLRFDHGLIAQPAQYGTTGTNTFIIDGRGTVYMRDTGVVGTSGIDGAGATTWPTAAQLTGAAAIWSTW
ncbi:MAG: DUF2950 family protein [Planctomycetota bacterium]|jgi:type IV pilus assembly protein PilA